MAALVVATSSAAQSVDQARCGGQEGASPDLTVTACTAVITSGQQSAEILAGAFYNRGGAYAAKGEYDRAIPDYEEATRLKPDYAEAFNGRSDSATNNGSVRGDYTAAH